MRDLELNREFLRSLKAMDPQAFSHLYDVYSPLLYGSISRLVPSLEKREVILMNVFSEISSTINSFDPAKDRLFIWMFAITQKQIMAWHEGKV